MWMISDGSKELKMISFSDFELNLEVFYKKES